MSLPPALARRLDLLRCPVGHTFDIARHGYASLLTGIRATNGDDAAMVQTRARFLSTGAYAPIRDVGGRLAADAMSEQGRNGGRGCGAATTWPGYSTICPAPAV